MDTTQNGSWINGVWYDSYAIAQRMKDRGAHNYARRKALVKKLRGIRLECPRCCPDYEYCQKCERIGDNE